MHDNVGRVFQQVIKGSSELAATQTRQWEHTQELATQLQSSLGGMRDGEVQAILGAFGSIHNQLVLQTHAPMRMDLLMRPANVE